MKVLHVYRTYFPDPPGGVQEAIRQICLSTQACGVKNTVFTLSPNPMPKEVDRPEARVVRCRSFAAPASCDLGGVGAIHTFRELARQADVVHYLFPWPFADLLQLIMRPTVPAFMTYHSDIVRQRWLGRAYAPLMNSTLKHMAAVVATSPAYARTSPVLRDASIRGRLRQIPLGIDESSYATKPDDSVFDRLALHPAEPFMLFVGVLRYYKGLHVLLDACARTQGRVVIAGSGPKAPALRAQAERLGLNNVVFAGQVTDAEKIALLKACRALVLSSHLRSEAFGMVLVEASMLGKPMVSCEIGTGTSFVNAHEQTGLVVPPEDPQALAAAMNTLLADEALARHFGAAARQRYETHFSGPALGQAYANLYRELLNR